MYFFLNEERKDKESRDVFEKLVTNCASNWQLPNQVDINIGLRLHLRL